MSDDLTAGLAATANESTHDTHPATLDAALDAAFESPAEGSDPSDPSQTTTPALKATAATTAQPQATTDPKVQAADRGPIPYDRHEAALKNARDKARDEVLAEHQHAVEIFQRLQSDLPGTLAQLLEEAAGDDRFSEAITAKAAALLNARKQKGKLDEEPQPDAVLRYEDGTTEPSYSPAQQRKWMEWRERQWKAGLMQELQPLTELGQQFQSLKQRAVEQQQAETIAAQRGSEWKEAPLFAEHRDAILKRQAELYADASTKAGFDPVNGPWSLLQRAYFEVINTQALPQLHAKHTDSLIADAARKRAGSASDPAAMPPAQPRKPRTPDEALDQVFSAYV